MHAPCLQETNSNTEFQTLEGEGTKSVVAGVVQLKQRRLIQNRYSGKKIYKRKHSEYPCLLLFRFLQCGAPEGGLYQNIPGRSRIGSRSANKCALRSTMPCRLTHRTEGRRGGPSLHRPSGGLRRRTILRPRQPFRGDLTKVEGTWGGHRHGMRTLCRVTPRPPQNPVPLRGSSDGPASEVANELA